MIEEKELKKRKRKREDDEIQGGSVERKKIRSTYREINDLLKHDLLLEGLIPWEEFELLGQDSGVILRPQNNSKEPNMEVMDEVNEIEIEFLDQSSCEEEQQRKDLESLPEIKKMEEEQPNLNNLHVLEDFEEEESNNNNDHFDFGGNTKPSYSRNVTFTEFENKKVENDGVNNIVNLFKGLEI